MDWFDLYKTLIDVFHATSFSDLQVRLLAYTYAQHVQYIIVARKWL